MDEVPPKPERVDTTSAQDLDDHGHVHRGGRSAGRGAL